MSGPPWDGSSEAPSTSGNESGEIAAPVRLEREIKLRFADPDAARLAIATLGAAPLRPRRLQRDALLDTDDGRLRSRRSILRLRIEPDTSILTLKGPVRPSTMKVREEMETAVADGALMLTLLERIGFQVWFRYEKYREEFASAGLTVALDETPIGTFVELEGDEDRITTAATEMGRDPGDYVLDSYRGLFLADCEARGIAPTDMLFPRPARD
jgi:adenylate cyclase class 2